MKFEAVLYNACFKWTQWEAAALDNPFLMHAGIC